MMSDFDEIDEVPKYSIRVAASHAGQRLDQCLAEQFSEFSRSRIQRWIKSGRVLIDGSGCQAKQKLVGGELITMQPVLQQEVTAKAEPIPLDIIYQDNDLLVVNKPAGLVVHPAAGNWQGTLLNGLLYQFPELEQIPRAGIVHRLDKETSGLLVVARTLESQNSLVRQLQQRSVKREYRALVQGLVIAGGQVAAPIARHPVNRLRMAVQERGKPAVSNYLLIERFRAHSHLKVVLETGRTHQIRVHMAHIRHSLIGDPLYGGRLKIPAGASESLRSQLAGFKRQALHAMCLALSHPRSGEQMQWRAPLPDDMQQLLQVLQQDAKTA